MQSIINKNRTVVFVLFLLAICGLYLLISSNLKRESSLSSEVETPKVHMVSILENYAEPDEVIVKLGEYVQFNSKDGKSHDIGMGKGNDEEHLHDHEDGKLQSGLFAPDEGFKVVFNKIGAYFFHDHINPNIIITIIAYDPYLE